VQKHNIFVHSDCYHASHAIKLTTLALCKNEHLCGTQKKKARAVQARLDEAEAKRVADKRARAEEAAAHLTEEIRKREADQASDDEVDLASQSKTGVQVQTVTEPKPELAAGTTETGLPLQNEIEPTDATEADVGFATDAAKTDLEAVQSDPQSMDVTETMQKAEVGHTAGTTNGDEMASQADDEVTDSAEATKLE
jgi:hypothetical protein